MQQEKETNFKSDLKINEVPFKKEPPASPVSQIVPSSSPNQNHHPPHLNYHRRSSVTKLSNSSDSDKDTKLNNNNGHNSDNQRNRSSSDITNNHSNSLENKASGSGKGAAVKSVRISSVVENIETKKTFPLDNSVDSTQEGEEMIESDDEKRDPYELTKFKYVAVNSYEPPEIFRPPPRKANSASENNHQPKVKIILSIL